MKDAVLKNKLWTVCIFILAVEMCERLCYYTIGGTQRYFLMDVPHGYNSGSAAAVNASFAMLAYLSCFLGGNLADNRLGRYKTIMVFGIVYFIGTVLVAVSAKMLSIPLYLVGCMVFVAVGTGAIKPNVMNFGASQYDADDPEEEQQQKAFFSYFYLMINVGSAVAYVYLVNLATGTITYDNEGQVISLGNGFFLAFTIAAVSMGLAILFFVLGSCRYKKEPRVVHKPLLRIVCRYLVNSWRCPQGILSLLGWLLMPVYFTVNLVGSIMSSDMISNISFLLTLISSLMLVLGHLRNNWIKELPTPDPEAGISLSEVKKALAMVPQILLVNIGFNICYNAMNGAYPAQACQMDLRIGGNTQLNGSFTNLGDCVAIIIGVPLFESAIYPAIAKWKGRQPSRKSKFVAGFFFAILANIVACVIEYVRATKGFVPGNAGLSKCAPSGLDIHMSDMSCWWAFVPMMLTGFGEILVNPVIYQFAFERSPPQLMSFVQALNLVSQGAISNALTGPLTAKLLPDNLNYFSDSKLAGKGPSGNVTYLFYTNAAIGVVCLVLYLIVSKVDDVPDEGSEPRQVHESLVRSFVQSGIH